VNTFRKMGALIAGMLMSGALMTVTLAAPSGASALGVKHAVAGRAPASAQGQEQADLDSSNPNSKGNGFYVCTWASTCEA
jgi:hypothetical protein